VTHDKEYHFTNSILIRAFVEVKMGSSQNSIINAGDLSKPATILIQKISEAIGGLARPFQIKRVAQAEVQAEIIKVEGQLEIEGLKRRALNRFLAEETKKQENIEGITGQAIPLLAPEAQPEKMDDDWIMNFFDKGKLISDQEMQKLWSVILAGEANFPGTYSKRTVNMLSSFDKQDAELFTNLCGYLWNYEGELVPLIFDINEGIYTKMGINYGRLTHLDAIGLISFHALEGLILQKQPKTVELSYFGQPVSIQFPRPRV
jgi:Protein of unknown function (DUF2806)